MVMCMNVYAQVSAAVEAQKERQRVQQPVLQETWAEDALRRRQDPVENRSWLSWTRRQFLGRRRAKPCKPLCRLWAEHKLQPSAKAVRLSRTGWPVFVFILCDLNRVNQCVVATQVMAALFVRWNNMLAFWVFCAAVSQPSRVLAMYPCALVSTARFTVMQPA